MADANSSPTQMLGEREEQMPTIDGEETHSRQLSVLTTALGKIGRDEEGMNAYEWVLRLKLSELVEISLYNMDVLKLLYTISNR